MPESFRRSGYYKDPSKTVRRRSHPQPEGGRARTHSYVAQPRGLIVGGSAAPSGFASTPDRASFTVPAGGTLRLRAHAALNTWRTGGAQNQFLLAQRLDGGQYSWALNMNDANINLAYSVDGTAQITNAFSSTKVPFQDGSPGFVEALLETDAGGSLRRNSFFYSFNGRDWIAAGSGTQSPNITLFDSTTEVRAGNFTGGGSNAMDGVLFEAWAWVNGVLVLNPKFHCQPVRQPNFRDDQGNLWTPGSGAIIGVV